jgi:vacuolar-type H+-ATPase subunit E/Vma4
MTVEETTATPETLLEETAQRTRQLSDQIIEASRKAGLSYLDAYEQALGSIAAYQAKLAAVDGDSRAEWLTTILDAQADYSRQVAQAVASYYRDALK